MLFGHQLLFFAEYLAVYGRPYMKTTSHNMDKGHMIVVQEQQQDDQEIFSEKAKPIWFLSFP